MFNPIAKLKDDAEKAALKLALKILIRKVSTMKLSWTLVFQALASAAQGANSIGKLVPAGKPQMYFALVVGILQLVVHWRQAYFNPDGTPASVAYIAPTKNNFGGPSMKMLLYAFVLVLALAVVAPLHAQNAPLATSNITANFTAVSLPGGGSTIVGTLDDLGVSFTPNSNLAIETVQAPTVSAYNGYYGPAFSYQFNGLSKWINNISPNLSGYKFRFTAIVSGGIARVGSSNHVAGNARFRSEYALSGSGSYSLLAEVGAGRLYTAPGWKPMISLGGIFHF